MEGDSHINLPSDNNLDEDIDAIEGRTHPHLGGRRDSHITGGSKGFTGMHFGGRGNIESV